MRTITFSQLHGTATSTTTHVLADLLTSYRWNEISKKDDFWKDFKKKVSPATIRRRFSITVDLNDEDDNGSHRVDQSKARPTAAVSTQSPVQQACKTATGNCTDGDLWHDHLAMEDEAADQDKPRPSAKRRRLSSSHVTGQLFCIFWLTPINWLTMIYTVEAPEQREQIDEFAESSPPPDESKPTTRSSTLRSSITNVDTPEVYERLTVKFRKGAAQQQLANIGADHSNEQQGLRDSTCDIKIKSEALDSPTAAQTEPYTTITKEEAEIPPPTIKREQQATTTIKKEEAGIPFPPTLKTEQQQQQQQPTPPRRVMVRCRGTIYAVNAADVHHDVVHDGIKGTWAFINDQLERVDGSVTQQSTSKALSRPASRARVKRELKKEEDLDERKHVIELD